MLLDKKEIVVDHKYNDKIGQVISWYLEKICYKVEHDSVDINECEDFLIAISDLLPIIPSCEKEKYVDLGYRLAKIIKLKIESNNTHTFYSTFFEGLGYSAYSIYSFNKNTGLLTGFLEDINKLLLDESYKKAINLIKKYDNDTNTFDYDAIYGLSGVLNYLFEFELTEKEFFKIESIIQYLVIITEKVNYNEFIIPKIFIPYENLTKDEKMFFLNGNINLGLAHGIAGPLKVLIKAKSKKYNVDRLDDAILMITNIYNVFEIKKNNVITWPPTIDLEEYSSNTIKNQDNYLDFYKWCYGSFSLSLILQDVYDYEDNKDLCLKYINNCKEIVKKCFDEYYFFTPNICHGYASMLAMQMIAYRKNKDRSMLVNINSAIENILNCFDEYNEYGFKVKLDTELNNELKKYEIDTYDFLDGTTGIVLALSLIFNDSCNFIKLLFFD